MGERHLFVRRDEVMCATMEECFPFLKDAMALNQISCGEKEGHVPN